MNGCHAPKVMPSTSTPDGNVIGMVLVNVRSLLDRDGELKITWPACSPISATAAEEPRQTR